MASNGDSDRIVRFGVFEVDLDGGELRRDGLRVNLQEKPFQVLALLLERPGEIITREEFQNRIWPDTFVDFEHSLGTAVMKVRDALGDDPRTPRFVETRPGRGYRFIYPVEGAAAKRSGLFLPRWAWITGGLAGLLLLAIGLNVGGLRYRLFGGVAPGDITSIAVLPLENLSGDPEQEWFADGMTDALITELGKISALRVISRQSVMKFKGSDLSLPEIAAKLNVDAIVEGTVLQVGDRVRITAQLIRADPEQHLWTEGYERELAEVLQLQGDLAGAIVREIRATLTPAERIRIEKKPGSVDRKAYEAYLKGHFFFSQRTQAGFEKAIEYFEKAIEIDPGYAEAYAGLAETYVVLPTHVPASLETIIPKAKRAALKALEIDDSLDEGHTALGHLLWMYEWEWERAEQEFQRALELNPGNATTHHYYAWLLSTLGRHDEALKHIHRAVEIDPLSSIIVKNVGQMYFRARDYEKVIPYARQAIELNPNLSAGYGIQVWAYLEQGMFSEALEILQEWEKLTPRKEGLYRSYGELYALLGRKDAAQEMIEELERLAGEGLARAGSLAQVYARLGEKDKAMEWLEKSWEEHDFFASQINVRPSLDFLREDPRFQSILRRMNFPE